MRGILVLGAACAAVAAAAPSVARADSSAEAVLAARYSPVVRLVAQQDPCGGGEPYSPTDVDAVLGNDQVALRGPWAPDNLVKVAPTAGDLAAGLPEYHLDLPGDALRPGCTYEQWQAPARRDVGADNVRVGGIRKRPDRTPVLVLLHLQRLQQQA